MSKGAVSTALVVLMTGCGPSVPADVVYAVNVPAGQNQSDVRVLRDGVALGTLADYRAGGLQVRVPSSIQPRDLRLMLEVPTVCGVMGVPLALEEPIPNIDAERMAREMEMYGEIQLNALDPLVNLAATNAIVDRPRGDVRPIVVGHTALAGAGPTYPLVTAGCTEELSITAGGETLASWRPGSGAPLIALAPGCYTFRRVGYGTAEGGGITPIDLRATRVHGLPNVPDYLFTEAPSSVWSGVSGEVHAELLRAACP